ncbi:MAG: UDP-glucose 4-epimerase [Parcubacteria group bacterium ADurb.Bin316]|nr:MAG: UDP-glucose 4-epimerase [Parcubacteria group bacterium ADurb.Bin316]
MNNKKIKILVTGSAGFMGSHLVDGLEEKGYNVYGIDDLSGGFMRNVSDKKKFTKLDLRDRQKVAAYIAKLKPEIIFHLAADATEGRSQFTPFSALDRNLVAYMNLIVPAIKNGMKKMILTSSMSVYGAQQIPFNERMITQPEDVYGSAKASMETVTRVLANVHGFRYVIIRPHNVYGPKQNISDPYRNVIGIFLNRLLHNKGFYIYGDGKQKRAFSYIDDTIPPMIRAAFNKKCEGRIVNVGGEEPITLTQLANILLEEYFETKKIPTNFEPQYLPARPQEVKYAFSNHDVARELIGFKPKTSMRAGLREMIKWAKEIGPQEFVYLDKFDLDNHLVPKTWKNKLL